MRPISPNPVCEDVGMLLCTSPLQKKQHRNKDIVCHEANDHLVYYGISRKQAVLDLDHISSGFYAQPLHNTTIWLQSGWWQRWRAVELLPVKRKGKTSFVFYMFNLMSNHPFFFNFERYFSVDALLRVLFKALPMALWYPTNN